MGTMLSKMVATSQMWLWELNKYKPISLMAVAVFTVPAVTEQTALLHGISGMATLQPPERQLNLKAPG